MNLIHIDDVKGLELALYVSTSEAGLLHRFEPAEGVSLFWNYRSSYDFG